MRIAMGPAEMPEFTIEFSATAWAAVGGLPREDFENLSRGVERAAATLRERNVLATAPSPEDRLASLRVGDLIVHYSVDRTAHRIVIRGIVRTALVEDRA